MRVSSIDVGSNTVRLLVADVEGPGGWRVVEQDQKVTRLGEGLATSGALGEAPMARTLAVVSDYVGRGMRLGSARVRIVATSAVREAANGRAFVAAVERATGRRVDVVRGWYRVASRRGGLRRCWQNHAGIRRRRNESQHQEVPMGQRHSRYRH